MKNLRPTKLLRPLAVQLGITCCAVMLPASASAANFYSGAHCVPVNGTPVYVDGMVQNASTTSELRVNCPVITDGTRGLEKAGVRVIDYSAASNVFCTLISRSSAARAYAAPRIESSGRGGAQNLDSVGVNGGGAGYRTYFNCVIPRKAPTEQSSGIEAYFALEPL
ncbi:hypothetical protein CR152_16050 [Massilia violaceinigra]|uniref:Fimbrial protein n=1 Tax=Massilia violaceinigra TaxID=2045208 RepID=A0A2D2DLM4_9BURK|nr:hypothetical protein [Massilia violaceinigra]ATQ75872.1 hypothetical protein CR152_16050 [Massilia violaceinigra]